ATAESNATDAVAPVVANAAPKNTAVPTISGTTRVGQTLTASTGSWSGSPTSYAFQWQHCDVDNSSICTDITGATGRTYTLHTLDLGYRMRVKVTARNAKGVATATSAATAVVTPAAPLTNHRPTLLIVSARFLGATMYARFRICDDSYKNLTIIETDSRPGVLSYTRRFTTLVAPKPCGVYTRHWIPAARFRGPGRYTLTLRARDKSGLSAAGGKRFRMRPDQGRRELPPRGDLELAVHAREVHFDRLDRDEERLRDLPVAQLLGRQLRNPPLTRRQRLEPGRKQLARS